MPKRVTIVDVARKARVSPGTVSRTLNGQRVTAERADRVRRAAQLMGYQGHFFAKGMRATQTNCVGIVISRTVDAENPWLQKLLLVMIDVLSGEGYDVIVGYWSERCISELRLLTFVDGCILLGNFPTSFYRTVEERRNIPLITYDEKMPYRRGATLQLDWWDGAKQAISYLLALGHRSIGLVMAGARYPSIAKRIQGCRDAMLEFRVALPDQMQVIADSETTVSAVEVREGTQQLLSRAPQITAIVYGTDRQALAGIDVLRHHGKRVPGDISVIGFDNATIASLISPALTTVGVDYRELSLQLLRTFEAIRDNRSTVSGPPISPTLFKRGTTAPPMLQAVARTGAMCANQMS